MLISVFSAAYYHFLVPKTMHLWCEIVDAFDLEVGAVINGQLLLMSRWSYLPTPYVRVRVSSAQHRHPIWIVWKLPDADTDARHNAIIDCDSLSFNERMNCVERDRWHSSNHENKLMDYGWLTRIAINCIFKFEQKNPSKKSWINKKLIFLREKRYFRRSVIVSSITSK